MWGIEKKQTALLGVIYNVFFIISWLIITVYLGVRLLSSGNAMIRFLTPILFATIPTQLSLCAISVSSKSCATYKSSFIANSDFSARKIRSYIILWSLQFRPFLIRTNGHYFLLTTMVGADFLFVQPDVALFHQMLIFWVDIPKLQWHSSLVHWAVDCCANPSVCSHWFSFSKNRRCF